MTLEELLQDMMSTYSMTNGCHGGMIADNQSCKTPVPHLLDSAATDTNATLYARARPLNDESCGVTWGIDCDSPFPLMEMVMARALSDDLRVRVLEAGAAGGSARSVAKRFGIGISTAIRWLRRERESGERAARRPGKPRGSKLDGHEAFIVGMIEAQKDITLNEMVARLKDEQSVGIGRSMLSRWLRQHRWTFKKRPHMHWSRSVKIS